MSRAFQSVVIGHVAYKELLLCVAYLLISSTAARRTSLYRRRQNQNRWQRLHVRRRLEAASHDRGK